MSTILDTIIARNRENFDHSASRRRELEYRAADRTRRHSFAEALSAPRVNVIAELKKASPSKGVIRADFPVPELARQLEEAGAAALSVLTEPYYFQGSPDYLRIAADTVAIPLLRKDFIFDELQILEAAVLGADAVLLIAAALDRIQMKDFHQFAKSLNLDTLCEIHDERELDTVMGFDADIIGINCRDLKTFKINHDLTLRLLGRIPSGKVRVAESGIHNHDDIVNLRSAGANAFLIGETLMRAPHPGDALRELIHEN
jgi:indole-3-glycerol phosphate synthase